MTLLICFTFVIAGGIIVLISLVRQLKENSDHTVALLEEIADLLADDEEGDPEKEGMPEPNSKVIQMRGRNAV